ncbi:MAG: tryptophan-rich sensory protein [Candidatus Kaiserbacteria bacterium]|nr:tryptophan-rich sensory protein [Candidatus Kaiserbacteria bacterium]
MRRLIRAGISLLACFGTGFLGTLFVSSGVGSWYDLLQKPWFNPPSWTFGIVWMVLYGTMAAALIIVWEKDPHAKNFSGWVPLFLVHLLLNAAWTIFFFGYHAIFVALIDIILLASCVILLTFGARDIDRRAFKLMMPYLAWVLFAMILNISIWYLN